MNILLTQNSQNDKIPTIKQEEVGRVRGAIREYRRGHFQVSFSYKGDKFFLYKYLDGTPLVHEFYARRLLEHINSLIDSHKFDPSAWRKDRPFLFEKAVQTWIDLSTCSTEWLDKRKQIAEKFLVPFFRGEDIRELRKIHVDNFYSDLKRKGYSDKYVYNVMGELKAFFYFHQESIGSVPVFPKVSYQDKPIHWVNEDEQDKIFQFIPERDKPIFILMKHTGCRPNEAGALLRENIFLRTKPPYFILSTCLGKGGRIKPNTKTKIARPLPVIPEIEEALKPKEATRFVFSKNGRPYTNRMLRYIWNEANKKANKEYGTPIINLYNGLKHSFGCQRLNAGFSIDEIKTVMGHTNKKTTERYARYMTEKLSDVMSGRCAKVVQLEKEPRK